MKYLTVIILVLMLFGAVLAASASPSSPLQQVAGELVDFVALKNGDAVFVTVGHSDGIQYLGFTYQPLEGGTLVTQIPLPYSGPADRTEVEACGKHVHAALAWDDGMIYYYNWEIPVELSQAFLPVVCR
jgi:hypothetical protein